MRKLLWLLPLLLWTSAFVIVGCEEEASVSTAATDTGTEFLHTDYGAIAYVNYTTDNQRWYSLDDGQQLYMAPGAEVYVQRVSCSGFDAESDVKLEEGMLIEYKYQMENKDFSGARNTIEADVIIAYRESCGLPEWVTPPPTSSCPEEVCNPCNNENDWM